MTEPNVPAQRIAGLKAAARRWAEEVRIKSGPKVVLQALVRYMNGRTGLCFPSVGTLVTETGLAESTVRVGLRDLEAHGLVSTTERRKEGRQTSSDYRLHVGAKPKPIGKRRDALRKAQQRASQAPKSGGWEDASSHRNMAPGQPPDTGPEYTTVRGGEEAEGSRGRPGEGGSGDERTQSPTGAASGTGSNTGPLANTINQTVPSLADGMASATGALPSQPDGEEIAPWPDHSDALSAVEALSVARPAEVSALKMASLPCETAAVPTRRNAEVVVAPCGDARPWSPVDWQDYFDERAGIAEYDGGLPREAAEAQAMEDCVAEWLDQHPFRSCPVSGARGPAMTKRALTGATEALLGQGVVVTATHGLGAKARRHLARKDGQHAG